MLRNEILETKQYLDVEDIKNIFACNKNIAYRIIREIKSVNDLLKISGKVSVSDYQRWQSQNWKIEEKI